MSANTKRLVPVYLPRDKVTIMVPKAISKLVFELNYKGLPTTRTEIDDHGVVLIQFAKYEPWRKVIRKWQLKETEPDAKMWQFLKDHVSIEMLLTDIEDNQPAYLKEHPYLPIIRFDQSVIEPFTQLFYAAKFKQ